MRVCNLLVLVAAIVCLVPHQSHAGITIYGTHADHPIIPGGSLSDVKMSVDLSVSGTVATMTFTNISDGLETTAVIAEIVLDTYDDDLYGDGPDPEPVGWVLWDPVILTSTDDVSFTFGDSNGLPGYHSVTSDMLALVEYQADSSPTQKGLNIGESLVVQFDTSLSDGEGIGDYFAFFDGGSDTAAYTIGFHAINTTTVYEETTGDRASLSGIYIPEPATMVMVGFGALLLLIRRKRR